MFDRRSDGYNDEHPLVILEHEGVRGSLGIDRADKASVGSSKVFQPLPVVHFSSGLQLDRATLAPLQVQTAQAIRMDGAVQ